MAPLSAQADTTGTYGDVTIVHPGQGADPSAFQLTSNPPAGYAGLYVEPSALDLNQITTLSADYEMTTGTFNAGAPRFSIADMSNNEAYVYWGTPQPGGAFTDPNAGTWANTGNYASNSSDLRVQVNGFDGMTTGASYITWSQFVADAGSTQIGFISLDLDGGFAGKQQMLADNFTVNSTVVDAPAGVPEPAAWAMMLVGFGALGCVARRRRRSVAVASAV